MVSQLISIVLTIFLCFFTLSQQQKCPLRELDDYNECMGNIYSKTWKQPILDDVPKIVLAAEADQAVQHCHRACVPPLPPYASDPNDLDDSFLLESETLPVELTKGIYINIFDRATNSIRPSPIGQDTRARVNVFQCAKRALRPENLRSTLGECLKEKLNLDQPFELPSYRVADLLNIAKSKIPELYNFKENMLKIFPAQDGIGAKMLYVIDQCSWNTASLAESMKCLQQQYIRGAIQNDNTASLIQKLFSNFCSNRFQCENRMSIQCRRAKTNIRQAIFECTTNADILERFWRLVGREYFDCLKVHNEFWLNERTMVGEEKRNVDEIEGTPFRVALDKTFYRQLYWAGGAYATCTRSVISRADDECQPQFLDNVFRKISSLDENSANFGGAQSQLRVSRQKRQASNPCRQKASALMRQCGKDNRILRHLQADTQHAFARILPGAPPLAFKPLECLLDGNYTLLKRQRQDFQDFVGVNITVPIWHSQMKEFVNDFILYFKSLHQKLPKFHRITRFGTNANQF